MACIARSSAPFAVVARHARPSSRARQLGPRVRDTQRCPSVSVASHRMTSPARAPSREFALNYDSNRYARVVTRASADGVADAPTPGGQGSRSKAIEAFTKVRPTLELGAMFFAWYYFSIAFNVYQKAILKAVPMPLTVTFCELAIGSALVAAAWASGLKSKPAFTKSMLKPLATLGVVHLLGNALTNVSLGKVAVSFTHTIKALEPVFSVALGAIFMGSVPSLALMATLVPIIAGVAIASCTEVSFNMPGFIAAMGSNLTFQSRNVLSKKMMGGSKEIKSLDYTDLLSSITILAMIAALPLAIAFEAPLMKVSTLTSSGMPLLELGRNILLASLSFQLYQQFSFWVLQRVSPVTHSVGNSLKRVVVIACSVLIFRNPVSKANIAGTALAIFGVFLYSQVKKSKGD